MIRVGIIGDIGSGKSYVAKKFGYPVFNADLEVSKIYKKNKKCFKKLNKFFPEDIKSFPINKKELFKVILAKKNNINKINKIVHSEVRTKLRDFINKNKKKRIIILDVPLLLENKINRKNDFLIYVDAKKKEIKKRIRKRKNFNNKIYDKLKKLQLSLELKKKKSNFIIKNNFKHIKVKKDVKMILKEILLNE